jgi:mediator of RNA polymerase II transcription subunit 12
MPEVISLLSKTDTGVATTFGKKMYARHGSFEAWSSTWWATVARAVSSSENSSVIEVTMAHIAAVDEELDETVTSWLDGLGHSGRVEMFGRRNSPLVVVLLRLVVQRRLTALTILSRMCYPAWKQASTTVSHRQSTRSQFTIENSVILSQQLLMNIPPHPALSPVNLCEAFVVQTTRTHVFYDGNVSALIRHLPFLVVLQKSPGIFTKTQENISLLIDSLGKTAEFKTAAFRLLDQLKDAFLSSEWSKSSNPELEGGMVDALKLIMSEGPSELIDIAWC